MSPGSLSTSPRRLIKQVALESPPLSNYMLDIQSTMYRSVTQEFKADKSSMAASGTGANVGPAKEEAYMTQRQRLRKIGPFAVDSQSIPDSRTQFAGYWPPMTIHKDDSDIEEEDAAQFNNNGASAEHKQVELQKFSVSLKKNVFFY